MREQLRLLLAIEREQIVPHLFVRLREPLFPFGRARIDRLCRTAIAKIGRRVREIDAVRRHLKARSEENTSELQSLMRNSYAVFSLKKNKLQRKKKQATYTNN